MKAQHILTFLFLWLALSLVMQAQPGPPPGNRQLDSLALVALYNSTGGPTWTNNGGWLNGPIDTWFGVLVNQNNNRVVGLRLDGNNLSGDMSDSVALMGALTSIGVTLNDLTGLPAGLANASQVPNLDVLSCDSNRLTFDDLIPLSQGNIGQFTYTKQQPVPPVLRATLYAGDSLILTTPAENNTSTEYQWFRQTPTGGPQPVQQAPTASPQYVVPQVSVADSGTYFCQITNPQLDDLILNSQDKRVRVQVLTPGRPRALGQVTVTYAPSVSLADRQALEARFIGWGAVKETCSCNEDIFIWKLPDPLVDSGVVYVGPEEVEAATRRGVPPNGDTRIGSNYPVNLGLNAPSAAQYRYEEPPLPFGTTPQTTLVAVIDLGVDITHSDIQGAVWTNPVSDVCAPEAINGYNFAANNGNAFVDSAAHGTHISGLITTLFPAVPIEVVSLKVGDWQASIFHLACAMNYAIQKKADVINMSMGYEGELDSMLAREFVYAQEEDIIVVTSAGNNSSNNGDPMKAHWPSNFAASMDNVLAVASLTTTSPIGLSSFSNYGAAHVNIAAPGEDINSALPGGAYGTKSGTSIANGFVSALAAAIRAYSPASTAPQVIQNIRSSERSTSDDVLDGLVNGKWRVNFNLINCAEKPITRPDTVELNTNSASVIAIDVRDNDCYSVGMLPTIESQPANGTLSIDANGAILYTPNGSFEGTDAFSYRLTPTAGDPNDFATAEVVVKVIGGGGGCTWWQILLIILLGLLAVIGLALLLFNNSTP